MDREVYGPLFHRWLPDGESDSISLLQSPGGTELRVWFDRCGYVDDKRIQFDPERREIDPEVMACQGLLDAGPLNAELRYVGVSDEEIAALRRADFSAGRTDPEPLYEALGKRVSKLIGPPIHKFTQLLAINYGQYWLQPWLPYDSTQHATLGSYFSLCGAQWKSNTGEKWIPFRPSRLETHFSAEIPSRFDEYLNKKDWRQLAQLAHSKEEPQLAVQCIALVNELVGQDRLRHALIECVTAFEVAFAERVTALVMAQISDSG